MLLFLLFTVALSAPTKPCRIGLRVDEIQDYWLVSTQKAVIQTICDKKVPASLGIISQAFGFDYDPNSQLVPFINGLIQGGADLEISEMSMDTTAWTNLNGSDQITACQRAKAKLTTTITANKRAIKTLHCPNNLFTQATVDALRNCSMSTISAIYTHNVGIADGRDFYSSCNDTMTPINGIVHVPSQAITSINGNGQPTPNSDILSAMETSCNSCGYSVLEIHFPEFSNNVTKDVNATAIANLGSIIDTIKAWPNVTFKVLQEMTLVTPPPTPVPIAPTPAPRAPTPVPIAPTPAPRAPTPVAKAATPTTPTTAPKATPTTAPKATPKTPNIVPKSANQTTTGASRTSGSASMHPIMFVVMASFILQALFG